MPPTPDYALPTRRHEVTLPGIIFIGITLFIMVAAINSGTNPLYFAFGLMLGGFAISGILSALALRKVEIKRIMADHVVAGHLGVIHDGWPKSGAT